MYQTESDYGTQGNTITTKQIGIIDATIEKNEE